MLAISFDLDGVLFDSETLVRQAYAEVGVSVVMDDLTWSGIWGRPWEHWLPMYVNGDLRDARKVHQAKNDAYRDLVRVDERPPTGACEYALDLSKTEDIYVHTSASLIAAGVICAKIGLPVTVMACGLDRTDKVRLTRGFVHIDDDSVVAEACARGIHYVGQSAIDLRKQVAWMRSS